jgi:hypothetical protein
LASAAIHPRNKSHAGLQRIICIICQTMAVDVDLVAATKLRSVHVWRISSWRWPDLGRRCISNARVQVFSVAINV